MSIDKESLAPDKKVVKDIIEAIRSVKFGYVQVIVQDSKVVQIDKTEKIRLEKKEVT